MRSFSRGRRSLWMAIALMGAPVMLDATPAVYGARWKEVFPACRVARIPAEDLSANVLRPRLRPVLDERGWLVGHHLVAHGRGGASLSLARMAFLDGPFQHRWVVGDARRGKTHLRVLDVARSCLEAAVQVDGLVFSASIDPSGSELVHDLVEPSTRRELGIWKRALVDLSSPARVLPGIGSAEAIGRVWANLFAWGPLGELAAQSCGALRCVTRSIDAYGTVATWRSAEQGPIVAISEKGLKTHQAGCHVSPCGTYYHARQAGPSFPLAEPPRVDPRPVPQFSPNTWEQDELLTFRWTAAVPNGWMRVAISDAAEDVIETRESRGAVFEYSPSGDDTIGLEPDMTGPCEQALACAAMDVPHWWRIRIRPQGTQLNWGTVRWCQAYDDPRAGCYDLEYVMIHEFGHIEGLTHPEDFGFRLGVLESVMTTDPPYRPQTGWHMHRFGPCDVARLQRRYDVPSDTARLADCGRVETRLVIEASDTTVGPYQPVTVTATLRIKDFESYDRLGDNRLSGRDVTVERRTHGTGTWISYSADRGSGPGTYVLSFRPGATADFRASFERPGNDGLTEAASGAVTVTVGSCTQPPCPESQSKTRE